MGRNINYKITFVKTNLIFSVGIGLKMVDINWIYK